MRLGGLLVALAGCGRIGFEDVEHGDGDVPDRPNLAFVTSTLSTAALGGIAGANALCQQRAQATNLPGSFVAFVWANGVDPSLALDGSRGWVDVVGNAIADTAETWRAMAFNQRGILAPLVYDEDGTLHREDRVWTGDATESCSDWTDTAGSARVLPLDEPFHASLTSASCASEARIACLGVGRVAAVAPRTVAGRIIFTTRSNFANDSGLGGADALCAAEASAASLNGTFRAFLATSTATPESRFTATGAAVRRVDGVMFAPSDSGLLEGTRSYFTTFLDLAAGGDWQPYATTIGIGGTCTNWSTLSSSVSAGFGNPLTIEASTFRSAGIDSCNKAGKLVCLQD